MKKCNYLFRILFVVLSLSLTSCEKVETEVKDFFGIETDDDKKDEYVDPQTALLRNVEKITKTAGDIYLNASTASDMNSSISAIKELDGVEAVWSDDLTLFVKIKDFGTVPYVFPPADQESSSQTRAGDTMKSQTRATIDEGKIHCHLDLLEVCIVNQQANDEGREWAKNSVSYADEDFSKCGFYVTVNNRPTVKFFAESMFNYDLLYINTPGCYDDREDLHWLFTGEEVATSEKIDVNTLKSLTQNTFYNYSRDKVGVGVLKEVRHGKEQIVYYLTVSENLIANGSSQRFAKPAIVFNSACQSVKHNSNLANAFIQKNAAVYLGYTEKSSVGKIAGAEFCSRLLSGMPIGYIYEKFPQEYMSESIGGVTAKLRLYYNNSYTDSYALFCLVHPEMMRVDNSSTENSLKVTLQGRMKTPDGYNADVLSYFTYGFCIGETPNFKEARVMDGLHVGDAGISYVNNQITFERTFGDGELKSGTNYYCWAYFYDGVNYCVSDSMTFTTPSGPAPTIEQVVTPEYMKYIQVIHDTVKIVERSTILMIIKETEYVPVYVGNNPPNIEGTYLISPHVLLYSTVSNNPSSFLDMYIKFYNQREQRIEYASLEQGTDQTHYGEGDGVVDVYISGFGEYFTVYLTTTNISSFWDSEVYSKSVFIFSGRKTDRGIEDITDCFLMLEKGADPSGHIVPVGTYRKFYDGDGLAENSYWPAYSRTRSDRPKGAAIDTPWSIYSTGK